ncbi:hypothetical protein [Thalassotalea crassostreae]|uniref:hypothetical protein n=1 Tax=Thalassotalea crassostreae TaxID=1763536 RepID=UPI000839537C|nr:hypothetical protein [Thalassotalea crassostreae]
MKILQFLLFVFVASFGVLAGAEQIRKPRITDTIKANIYADNSFKLYINGTLIAVDSIAFMPHNVISVDILPSYPMTIAVMAMDNADPVTGLEYGNTSIGDGGFILKLGDGTVTNSRWKVKKISWGPIDRDIKKPRTKHMTVPEKWFTSNFDDRGWVQATEFTQQHVRPKAPFFDYDFKGASFIWSDDLELDNIVLFRRKITKAPDGLDRPNFTGLSDQVPSKGKRQKKRK